MKVICDMRLWTTSDGGEKTYPWISNRKDFYERNNTMPRFSKTANACKLFDDMRDEPNNTKNCCECFNCKRVR